MFAPVLLALGTTGALAQDFPYPIQPVFVPHDLAGNAQYPPAKPYELTSHDGTLLIRDGLPLGSAIVGRLHVSDMQITAEAPGGTLGGEQTDFSCIIGFEMRGVGAWGGWSRSVSVPAIARCMSGPQLPGTSPQVFQLELDLLQGQILGDPDFDLLRITAGTSMGMPSPGRAIATLHPSGEWRMDSFFDITYRVDFVGRPAGSFAGLSGSTVYTHRQRCGPVTPTPFLVSDDGTGTAAWPPVAGGAHDSRTEAVLALDGPVPFFGLVSTMQMFDLPGSTTSVPGGELGGTSATWQQILTLDMKGEGDLGLYARTLSLVAQAEADYGPAMPLHPHQGRPAKLHKLYAQIGGDPDFDLLRVYAGSIYGLPSEGHVSLTHDALGQWRVDSFFDITYRVDFVGAPGGPLAGKSGSYVGKIRCQMGEPREGDCYARDNGTGTIDFPAMCAPGYASVRHAPGAYSGMPLGSPLLVDVEMLPLTLFGVTPGGSLGGEEQAWDCGWRIHVVGTGAWSGFDRHLLVNGPAQTHTAPRTPGTTPQHFETLVHMAQGQIIGDPDFDLLRITAGNGFGLPSPGHTTLTSAGLGWDVDSFFDITYRVDFIGAPGGALAGMSGSTTARRHFVMGQQPVVGVEGGGAVRALRLAPAAPNPARFGTTLALELPQPAHVRATVHDVAGRRVATLADGARGAGLQALRWNGRHADGRVAAPGVYLVRVMAGEAQLSRRVIVTR